MKAIISIVSAYYLLNLSFSYATERKSALHVFGRKFLSLATDRLMKIVAYEVSGIKERKQISPP